MEPLRPSIAGARDLRAVTQGLDPRREFHEGAETGRPANTPSHNIADHVRPEERFPRIRLKLLDAERKPAVRRIDIEYYGLNKLTFLQQFRRMLDTLGPGEIGDMNQSVDPLLDFDERPEIGQFAHAAFDHRTNTIALRDSGPRIRLELFDPQRDAALPRFHFEHHRQLGRPRKQR